MTTDGGGSAGTGNGLRWLASSHRATLRGGRVAADGHMPRYKGIWRPLQSTR